MLLVDDFAYADIAFDGYRPPSLLEIPGALDCSCRAYSLTKSFSMAGWRVGFVAGRADVVAALAKLKSYLDYGTFQPIQIASIVALREAPEYPEEVTEIYRGRRDVLCAGLDRAGWHVEPPQATMFVWAPVPERFRAAGSLSSRFELARKADVAVSPGVGFGKHGEGFVRFALVENEQRIGQAVRNIRRFLNELTRRGSRPRDCSLRGGADQRRVFRQRPLGVARRGRPPLEEPPVEFVVVELDVHRARLDVDADDVAVLDERDRAACCGLGRNVTDHEAVRGAREAPVGDERDVRHAAPLERGRDLQHLTHAWAAARALVADDDDVALADAAALDRLERGFLAVEHARGAFEVVGVVAHKLDHRAVRRHVAIDDRVGAARENRIVEAADHLLARVFDRLAGFFEQACGRRRWGVRRSAPAAISLFMTRRVPPASNR